jgi:two-component sensor histidine kinase
MPLGSGARARGTDWSDGDIRAGGQPDQPSHVSGLSGPHEKALAQETAAKRQELLIHELNHRVRNTLATVQSLAWQVARPGVPPQTAQQRFQERLLALSRTHNLLNETLWEGACLRDSLEAEFRPYMVAASRVRLSGPDVHLPATQTVVLGMAFHELTTNAVKY